MTKKLITSKVNKILFPTTSNHRKKEKIMRTGIKVFVAVAVGAFIGTLTALKMTSYFWWVGMLTGGLVGYLSYKPMETIRAIPGALRTAWLASFHGLGRTITGMWRWRKKFLWNMLGSLTMVFWLYGVCIFGCTWLMTYHTEHVQPTLYTEDLSTLSSFLIMLAFATFIFLPGFTTLLEICDERPDLKKRDVAQLKEIAVYANPFRVCFYYIPKLLFYWLPIGLFRLGHLLLRLALQGLASVITFVVTFVVTLFKTIHSDIRVLCAIDSAIGAAIGFFFVNPIIGAVVGGLFGWLNYEVVSKRWLKLVPVKTK